jgi:hypothetical protein
MCGRAQPFRALNLRLDFFGLGPLPESRKLAAYQATEPHGSVAAIFSHLLRPTGLKPARFSRRCGTARSHAWSFYIWVSRRQPCMTCVGSKCSLPQNPLLPRAARLASAALPARHCSSQRKRDRAITFLLPSCFLILSGFRFNPLAGRPQPHPTGCGCASSRGWGPCCASPRLTISILDRRWSREHDPNETKPHSGFARKHTGLRLGTLPLLAPPARTKRRHSRLQTAVESLVLPVEPFPPSSPPRHRSETLALFREKKAQPDLGSAGVAVICEGRRGEWQDSLESEPVMGQEPHLPL